MKHYEPGAIIYFKPNKSYHYTSLPMHGSREMLFSQLCERTPFPLVPPGAQCVAEAMACSKNSSCPHVGRSLFHLSLSPLCCCRFAFQFLCSLPAVSAPDPEFLSIPPLWLWAWNLESWCSCCLSPTRPNQQREGLNLYGPFIQKAGDLRRRWVSTLTDGLKSHFKQTLFIRRREVQVRGLEFREKLTR